MWYELCCHIIAVAYDTGSNIDFLAEKKKIKEKKKGLTTQALKVDLTDKEKGLKQDNIANRS